MGLEVSVPQLVLKLAIGRVALIDGRVRTLNRTQADVIGSLSVAAVGGVCEDPTPVSSGLACTRTQTNHVLNLHVR